MSILNAPSPHWIGMKLAAARAPRDESTPAIEAGFATRSAITQGSGVLDIHISFNAWSMI
jgi:hypothetical protein